MSSILEYKGYCTKVEYSAEDQILFGKIEGINDLVTFEERDPSLVEKAFHEAVDDYLYFCEDIGQEPNKVYKGTFNVRISPELHRELAMTSFVNGDSLNQSVEKAIQSYLHSNLSAVEMVCESMAQATLTLVEMNEKWAESQEVNCSEKNTVSFSRIVPLYGS